MSPSDIKIGSKVYVYDENRRHYRRTPDGRSYGNPIEIDCWVEHVIDGENRVNWICGSKWSAGNQVRINKKNPFSSDNVCFNLDEARLAAWRKENRVKIANLIGSSRDPKLLIKVAELIGYEIKFDKHESEIEEQK